ncbi:MAG: AsnC family transcriptional regulator [Hydrogenophilales bacterium]|nr:AsnC family transcriptional regulator [Hydrogenophilales bacterium]
MNNIDQRLLNDYQRGFPLSAAPYADIAHELGITEDEVIARLQALKASGAISRVGAVVRPNTIGVSTLAAIEAPAEELERIAAIVSAFPEVNHNYEREHAINLWFVITARNALHRAQVLADIAAQTGYAVHSFPLERDFHIDLGFELKWT